MKLHNAICIIAFLLTAQHLTAAEPSSRKACDSVVEVAIQAMWQGNHTRSLELLSGVNAASERHRWHAQQFSALNNTGGNYYLMLDYGEALNYYLKAYKIACTYLDAPHEMTVINNIGLLYSKQGDADKAEEYFLKAYALATAENDPVKAGFYAINLGSLYNEKRQAAKARNYLNKAVSLLGGKPQQLLLARIALAKNLLISGQIVPARQKAEALLLNLPETDRENRIVLTILIAQTHQEQGKYAMARQWLHRALGLQPDLEKKRFVYEQLSQGYFKTGGYAQALQYKDSVMGSIITLQEKRNEALFASTAARLKLEQYKAESDAERAGHLRERWLLGTVIVALLLVVVVFVLVFRSVRIAARHKKLRAEQEAQINRLTIKKLADEKQLLADRERIAVLEQQRLFYDMEMQQQRIASKALYISERDRMLRVILQGLGKIPELERKKILLGQINKLKRHISMDKDWEQFSKHFEEVNQGFLRRLLEKHPNLNSNDMRFLSYAYMNLTPKEIATVLNISPEAYRKRKERLMAKLALTEEIGLNTYLISI